jgi:hypothetical protein
MGEVLGGAVTFGDFDDTFIIHIGAGTNSAPEDLLLHTYVGRIEFDAAGDETFTLWQDATNETDPSFLQSVGELGTNDLGTVFSLTTRYQGAPPSTHNALLDNLMFGTAFDLTRSPPRRAGTVFTFQ